MFSLARRPVQTMSGPRRFASSLSPLLSTEEAQTIAESGRVRFLDASWYLDKSRDAKKEFALERLPKAQFFDIEQISDTTSTLPHMLPTPETFEHAMRYLGVENDDTVIVYGGKNCFSPARCWWTFKYFGHDNVHILNGGITKWKSESREIETGEPQTVVAGAAYKAKPNEALAVSWEDVLAKVGSDTQIVDARGAARFFAKEPEPRPGMRGGHIPGSVNVPFGKLVSPDDFSLFRDVAEIKSAFAEANVKMDETSPVITSCGSGVTASILTFGLHLTGKPLEKAPVYDGSWSEWGLRSDVPIETEVGRVRFRITSQSILSLALEFASTSKQPLPASEKEEAVQVHKSSKDFRAATKIVDVPELPTAGPGNIAVKNSFLDINSTDVNLTNGMYNDKLPFIAGVEGAGIINEVGKDVATVQVGDAVMYEVPNAGGNQDRSTHYERTSRGSCGVSALMYLDYLFEMESNETVLITAAAGSTGQFVVPVAKLAGNHVIGTTSSGGSSQETRL